MCTERPRQREVGEEGALAAALVAVGLTIAACGGEDGGGGGGSVKGGSLTIYSSLPLQGAARNQAVATVNGIKLKLKQVDNKVGKYSIKYGAYRIKDGELVFDHRVQPQG